MSGFEVVGVVLAAFPIILSAIDGYGKGLEHLDTLWRYDKKLKVFERQVQRERQSYRNNLEQLLEPLIDVEELKMLLDNPRNPAWGAPALREEVRRRLSGSYETYISTVEDFNEVLNNLEKSLDKSKVHVASGMNSNQDPGKATSPVGEIWKHPHRKIKFALTSERRISHVRELKDLNQKLSEFLQHEERKISRVGSLSARKLRIGVKNSALSRFWKSAERLYALVEQAWCCTCHDHHTADMVLQHPSKFDEIQFKILFTSASRPNLVPTATWKRREIDIIVVEKEVSKAVRDQRSPIKLLNESSEGTLRFGSGKQKSRTSRGLSLMMQTANLLALPPMQPEEIRDLCGTIATRARSGSCLGALMDQDSHFSMYNRPSKLQKDLDGTGLQEITLEQLLRNPPANFRLENRQKHLIARSVASAYLQLHASPWIGSDWRRQDIYFWYDATKCKLYEQPQISSRRIKNNTSTSASHDESIWTLGIALLEICSGIALEDEPQCQKYLTINGQPNSTFVCAAAMEWCRNLESQIGTPLADAIHWCLHHSASKRHMELNDLEWREGLFVNVVEPIAKCYDFLFASLVV